MWIADKNDRRIAVGWRQACEAAAGPEFDHFRQLPMIGAIVGNHDNMAEYQLRRALTSFPGLFVSYEDMLPYIKQLASGSQLGSGGIALPAGQNFCPAECRYLAAFSDIMNICSSTIIRIAEIGGGYGGLCRMMCYSYPGIAYHLIDIPQALKLQERFVQTRLAEDLTPPFDLKLIPVSIHTTAIECPEVDLVVGMYSLSELGQIERENYYRLIQTAKHGYFAWNYLDDDSDLLDWRQAQYWLEGVTGRVVLARQEIPNNSDSGHILWW